MSASVSSLKSRVIEAAPDRWLRRYVVTKRSGVDMRRFVADAAMIGFTSVLPPQHDAAATDSLGSVTQIVCRRRRNRTMAFMERVLDTPDQPGHRDWRATAADFMQMRVEVSWARARGAGLRRSKPLYTLRGEEHLNKAIAAGNGVVLWRMMFTHATPINAALADVGHPLVHLSSDNHMTRSHSAWARRVVSPLLSTDEARFLRRRILRTDGTGAAGLGYMRELKSELARGAAISILGTQTHGRAAVAAPFGNEKLRFPTGAPSLAYKTGAALLPCHAIRTGPHRYEVIIGSELVPDRTLTKRQFRSTAIERFAIELERHAQLNPSSCQVWDRSS